MYETILANLEHDLPEWKLDDLKKLRRYHKFTCNDIRLAELWEQFGGGDWSWKDMTAANVRLFLRWVNTPPIYYFNPKE